MTLLEEFRYGKEEALLELEEEALPPCPAMEANASGGAPDEGKTRPLEQLLNRSQRIEKKVIPSDVLPLKRSKRADEDGASPLCSLPHGLSIQWVVWGQSVRRGATSTLSTRRPSISTTSKRSPPHSKGSPVEGTRPREAITNPPKVQ